MNDDKILSDLDRKVMAGRQLGVFNDRLGRKLMQLYHKGILDFWSHNQIINKVDKQLRKDAFRDIPFKSPQLHTGKLIIGKEVVTL